MNFQPNLEKSQQLTVGGVKPSSQGSPVEEKEQMGSSV